jgi:dephospho-CoA kinase
MQIGLTGGIGSGKSTAARRFAELGALVIDSDVVAREVVEPGTPGLAAVVDAFGPGVLDAGGRLDRPALARVVFGDEAARRRLNGIVHPLVRARAAELVAAAPAGTVVVQDVPLLVETGQAGAFDLVVVVEAPVELRVSRLAGRGLPAAEARARMASQATDADRRAVADAVLVNDGTEADLRAQVDRLWTDRVAATGG